MQRKLDFSDLNTSGENAGKLDFSDLNTAQQKSEENIKQTISKATGLERSPYSALKDIVTGLGEAGQNVASTLTGDYAPRVNMQETFGTQQGNPLIQGIGQYAPLIASAPESLPLATAEAGAYGYTQGRPGEKNLFGLLPSGRIGSAIENALIPPAFKAAKSLPNVISKSSKLITQPFRSAKPFEQAAEQAGQAHEAVLDETPAGAEKSALKNAEDQLNQHLNIGAVHKTDVASGLTNRVKSIEDYWSNAYQSLKDKIKNLNVNMPKQTLSNYGLDIDSIRSIAQQPGGLEKLKAMKSEKDISNPYLKELMDVAPSSSEKNASKFLENYQDFKAKRFDLRQQMKTASTHAERSQIKEALNQSEAVESAANKALQEGLGEHAPELARVNEGYSTQVYPLRSNPIIRKAKIGKLPTNIVDAIGSNEPGMPLVRELVKQDPQLLRNVVGQRYAVNPEEILNPHAGMREFTNEMPELNKLLQQHQTASQNVESALEDYAKRKDISLKNKVQAEKELKEMKKSRSRARYIGSGVLGMIGVPYAGRKILGYLSSGEE